MDRKEIRKGLLGVPGAIGGAAAAASVWQTPRDWIGGKFAALGSAMTHPWVTVLVTLLLIAYMGAILWTFISPRAPTVAETQEIEADRERRSRRRKMLNEAREMVANHELQARRDWWQTIRYSPEYAAIRPHLSAEYLAYETSPKTRRTVSAGPGHQPPVDRFCAELDRLEREWKLS
jgi:hypothetical protein